MFTLESPHRGNSNEYAQYTIFNMNKKQEGHEALKRSPEYTGQSQTFNFEIWMTFGQVQRMTLTFDTHSTSLTHLAECFKRL